MMAKNHIRKPTGILLIAGFYFFGALVLLITLFTNPDVAGRTIADAHGLFAVPTLVLMPIVAVIAIAIAFGLYAHTRWGYFLTLGYLAYLGCVSIWLIIQNFQQPYIGNLTWAILVSTYLIWKRDIFLSR